MIALVSVRRGGVYIIYSQQFLIDLARARLAEMEKRGILPKGK